MATAPLHVQPCCRAENAIRRRAEAIRGAVGDHHAVLDLLSLFGGHLWAALRGRRALVVENVLLRQQFAEALRLWGDKTLSTWHSRSHRVPGGAAGEVRHGGTTVGHAAPRARRYRVWTVSDP